MVEKEKQIQMDIARESGKPEAVIEKMIVGRMKKFLSEVTLLSQQFVVNPDLTVVTNLTGQVQFTDPLSTNTQRFYRALLLE